MMKGSIVFSMVVILDLMAALSPIDDHYLPMLFQRSVGYQRLDIISRGMTRDGESMVLQRRGTPKKGKETQAAPVTPTAPQGGTVAGRIDSSTPGLGGGVRPPSTGRVPLPVVTSYRARSKPTSERKQQKQAAGPSPTSVRRVPDSGATLAHADESSAGLLNTSPLGAPHFESTSRSSSLGSVRFPSPERTSSRSDLKPGTAKEPRQKSISPDRPSTSRRQLERSTSVSKEDKGQRSSSSSPGSPPAFQRSTIPPTGPPPTASASRPPDTASDLASLSVRPPPENVADARASFNDWLSNTKSSVRGAKVEAAVRAPRLSTYPESEATKQIGAKEVQAAKAAKVKAKRVRATAKEDYKKAMQVMAAQDVSRHSTKVAFVKSSLSTNGAVRVTKEHADAEEQAAQKLRDHGRWTTIPRHIQNAGLAYQHAIVRNQQTKAFQDRYTASISSSLVKITEPTDSRREEAVVQAVQLNKNYRSQVHLYREHLNHYQRTQEAFSGSESDESEKSFSDVPKT